MQLLKQSLIGIAVSSLIGWNLPCYADAIPKFAVNCLKQTTRLETVICADPDLEKADKSLNEVFHDMAEELNSDELASAIQEQKEFLPLREQCIVSGNSLSPLPTPSEKQCLLNLYGMRYAQVESWPTDEAQTVNVGSTDGSMQVELTYNRFKHEYEADATLYNNANENLNHVKFSGCTPNTMIINLASYLQQQHMLGFINLPQGVVIQNLLSCGQPKQWQMVILTPQCSVIAPDTDSNGNPMSLGNNANRIYFAYMMKSDKGYEILPSFLDIDDKGKISYTLPPELKAKNVSPLPNIECQ